MTRILLRFGFFMCAWGTLSSAHGASLAELEAIASQADSLTAFLSNPTLVKAYRNELKAYAGRERFRCQSFDEILAELRRLNAKVPRLGNRLWQVTGTSPVIRASEFTSSQKGRTPGTPWSIRPVARRFHGIWVDPSQQGCVAPKACEQADVAAPRRWAIGLDGAKMFLVEKGNRFQGSAILLLPLRGKGSRWNLVVASGSARVQRRAYFRVGRGAVQRQSLLGIWQKVYRDPFPMTELAYLPNSPQIAHIVSLETQKPVGFVGDFTPGDPMASLIEEASPRECHRASLKELGWNVFAGFGSQSQDEPTSTGNPSLSFNSGGDVKNFLLNINPYNPNALDGVPGESLPQLQKGLKEALTDPDPKVREKAAVTINLLGKKKRPRDVAGQTSTGSPSNTDVIPPSSSSSFTPGLRKALRDPFPPVRDAAARGLADNGAKDPEVNDALSDSIRRPGGGPVGPVFPFPRGSGGGTSGEGGLSPLERARQALDAKLRNGLPVTDEDLERLLDKAKRSNDPKERDAAGRTFADAARDPSNRGSARSAFARRCSGPNPPTSAEECRRLRDQLNEPQDPNDPKQCKNCPKDEDANSDVREGGE